MISTISTSRSAAINGDGLECAFIRGDLQRLTFIKPQEPILVEVPRVNDEWLHEIKHDGFRTQLGA